MTTIKLCLLTRWYWLKEVIVLCNVCLLLKMNNFLDRWIFWNFMLKTSKTYLVISYWEKTEQLKFIRVDQHPPNIQRSWFINIQEKMRKCIFMSNSVMATDPMNIIRLICDLYTPLSDQLKSTWEQSKVIWLNRNS